jgi:hypothetical protein
VKAYYFKNCETGEEFFILDIFQQANRAKKAINKFCQTFKDYVSKGCVYMKTLTVHKFEDQEKALKDYSRFWNSYSQRIKRKGYKILGVLFVVELQKRGVIHFHTVFVTDKPIYFYSVPGWLKADVTSGRYKRLWSWGCTNIVRIEKSLKRYLAKYFCNSKKITKHSFTYLYDLRKVVGKGKKLFYCYVAKQARNLAYKLFNLPTSVYNKIRNRLQDILDIEPFFQDNIQGFLVIFRSSFEFVSKPKYIFLGYKEIEGA